VSLPVVLLRIDGDVVPVILGTRDNELAGYDIVRERVVPVDLGKATGAVNMDPAAVYWGLSVVEEERGETRMAAEADHSCFPPGLQDAREDVQYWDDLSPEEKQHHRQLYRDSIDQLKMRTFPFDARWGDPDGRPVRVLGFVHDFPPYNDGPYPPQPYDDQMMAEWQTVESGDGDGRFITFAKNLFVDGRRLAYRHGYKLSPSKFEVMLQNQLGGSAREDFLGFGRVSVETFAATFLANVEGSGKPRAFRDDPRTETIAATLRALGVESVKEILGAGSFGTAALLDEQTVIKLTSDPSEVQAGSILRGQRLKHVAAVHESFFIRGVRAKTIVAERGKRKVRVKNPVGVLTTERVTPIPEDHAAEQLSETVNEVKGHTKTWPDQLARADHAAQKARLKRASKDLEGILRDQAKGLDDEGREGDSALARGVADALAELRERGIYAIDAHEGNVGFVKDGGKVTYKLFDIGSSSPPARPKAETVDPEYVEMEQLALPGMLEEGAVPAGWTGEGSDVLESTEARESGAVAWKKLDTLANAQIMGGAYLGTEDGKYVIMARRYRHGDKGYREYVIHYTTVEYEGSYKTGGTNRTLYDGQSLDKAKAAVGSGGAQEAPRLASPPKYEAKGIRFTPIESGVFGGEFLTGYPDVRPVLLRHRTQVPSLETIILSTVFAGLTVHTQIATAEKSFRCVADRIRGGKLPTLSDIDDCLVPLGLIKSRRAMYESAGAWAPLVRQAIESGLKDRELRRHLYLTTETPHDIALAKLSFVLALLGHDCVCLDARILNRMFDRDEANKLAHEFGRPPTERMLERYEAVEDAFLENNAFYRPNDPIGRARAQWESWQAVGGAPARHDAWLHVVSGQ